MPWAQSLEDISKHVSPLIKAAEHYAQEIRDLRDRAAQSSRHSPKTLKVWGWQVDAADAFSEQAQELHTELMRIAEQDYVLRRPDADDILV
jgi:uncharacterized protein YukE